MKTLHKTLLSLALCLTSVAISADDYPSICSLVSNNDTEAIFESASITTDRKKVEAIAIQSLFYTLFYQGITGFNDDQPLIQKDNKAYTNGFFNEQGKYSFYVTSITPLDKLEKVGDTYKRNYKITLRWKKLANDLQSNKVFINGGNTSAQQVARNTKHTPGMTLPTILIVPYKKDGESYSSIIQNDNNRRIAVSTLQQGFEEQGIKTVDLQAKLNAVKRRADYDANNASSNDRLLLQTSGADIYIEADMQEDIQNAGTRVTLTLKAYQTANGDVLASKVYTTNRRYKDIATDVICHYTVNDNIPDFIDQLSQNLSPENGSNVTLNFAIASNSPLTMNDPVGRKGYSLQNVIRQWVRKNAYEGKYHLEGMVDESMIFDYVTIPPLDEDGLKMDAGQFAFLLEQYLKEEESISCTVRLDGNTIYITFN